MNLSHDCATDFYSPAAKNEKSLSDVSCTCPYCGSILTWGEIKENVMLHKRDSMIN